MCNTCIYSLWLIVLTRASTDTGDKVFVKILVRAPPAESHQSPGLVPTVSLASEVERRALSGSWYLEYLQYVRLSIIARLLGATPQPAGVQANTRVTDREIFRIPIRVPNIMRGHPRGSRLTFRLNTSLHVYIRSLHVWYSRHNLGYWCIHPDKAQTISLLIGFMSESMLVDGTMCLQR
ncbi:hypothetical protein K449DRAFT_393656 [Hypoxylon sp. EC38]|nr:hypothetical protein K449DRAFT_393656 [Hypoxylon sp. EC38]